MNMAVVLRPIWRLGFSALLLAAAVVAGSAQGFSRYQIAGQAIASQFNWKVEAEVVAPDPGPGKILFDPAWRTLPDGAGYEPWKPGVPVTIQDGLASEMVTLTSSTCHTGMTGGCSATAIFQNAHRGRLLAASASGGLQEAINYLGARGGGTVILSPDWSGSAATIATATGGSQTAILDQRNGAYTWYGWQGNGYSPAAAIQPGGAGLSAAVVNTVRYANQFPGADIGAQINAAYASCPDTGCTIRIPAGEYRFSTPVRIATIGKPAWIIGDGAGTILTWTASTGTAFQFAPVGLNGVTHPDGLYGLRNLQLYGPGGTPGACPYDPAVTATGLELGGAQSAEGFGLENARISCFGTDVLLGSNVWGTEFRHFALTDGVNAVLSLPSGSVQTGENLRFEDGLFANDWTAPVPDLACAVSINSTIGGDLTFANDSFDGAQLCNQSGVVTLFAPHFENPGNNLNVPFIANQADPGMFIFGAQFAQDATPAPIAEFIQNNGVLDVDGLNVAAATQPQYFLADAGDAMTRITGNINVGSAFQHWIDHTGSGQYWIDENTGNFLYNGTPLFSHGLNLQGSYLYQSANICNQPPATGIIGGGGSAWAWNYACGGETDLFSYKGGSQPGGFAFYGWDGSASDALLTLDPTRGASLAGALNFASNPGGAAPTATAGGSLTTNFSAQYAEVNFWNDTPLAPSTAPAFDWHIFDAGGAPYTVATLDRSGDLALPGALSAASLSLSGGPPLTAETGTGPALVTSTGPTIASPILTGTPVLPGSYTAAGAAIQQPTSSGTLALTSQLPISATSSPLGGAGLAAGACTSTPVTAAGAQVGMAVAVSPTADPGPGLVWEGWVSSAGVATVRICNVTPAALTPLAATYSVRVLP